MRPSRLRWMRGQTSTNSDGLATPLVYAVNRQHLDAPNCLSSAAQMSMPLSKIGGSPLMAAVAKNRLEFITLLLAHGANPNSTAGKQTPLHVAVKHGCLDLRHGAGRSGRRCQRPNSGFLRADTDPSCQVLRVFRDIRLSHGAWRRDAEARTIAEKLAAADVEKGRIFFGKNCDGCHTNEPGKGGKTGPNLWEVVGRDKASVPEFNYSRLCRVGRACGLTRI